MAGFTGAFRPLAHPLLAAESVGAERGSRAVWEPWQRKRLVRVKREVRSLDRMVVRRRSDGTGAPKKRSPFIGRSRGGGTTRIHRVATEARTAVKLS